MPVSVKKIAHLTGHRGAVFSIAQGRTPSSIISAGGDGWVVEWDLDKPDLGRVIAQTDMPIYALLPLWEHNIIVAGNRDGGIHFINLTDATLSRNIQHHQKGVFDLYATNDGVVSLGGDGMLTRWSLVPIQSIESLHLTAKSLRSVAISGVRNELVIGASDGSVYILDKDSWELKQQILQAHTPSVFAACYAPDERFLLTGGRDALLKLWSIDNTEKPVQSLPAHLYTINAITFHPTNPNLFATASRDKTIKIWSLTDYTSTIEGEKGGIVLQKVIDTIRQSGHLNSVNQLLWTKHHNWLVSCSDDSTLMVWEVTDGDK
jgi:WD40 repeat protein